MKIQPINFNSLRIPRKHDKEFREAIDKISYDNKLITYYEKDFIEFKTNEDKVKQELENNDIEYEDGKTE